MWHICFCQSGNERSCHKCKPILLWENLGSKNTIANAKFWCYTTQDEPSTNHCHWMEVKLPRIPVLSDQLLSYSKHKHLQLKLNIYDRTKLFEASQCFFSYHFLQICIWIPISLRCFRSLQKRSPPVANFSLFWRTPSGQNLGPKPKGLSNSYSATFRDQSQEINPKEQRV